MNGKKNWYCPRKKLRIRIFQQKRQNCFFFCKMSENGVFFDEKFFDVVMLSGKWPESINVTSPHQKYPKDVPKFFKAETDRFKKFYLKKFQGGTPPFARPWMKYSFAELFTGAEKKSKKKIIAPVFPILFSHATRHTGHPPFLLLEIKEVLHMITWRYI